MPIVYQLSANAKQSMTRPTFERTIPRLLKMLTPFFKRPFSYKGAFLNFHYHEHSYKESPFEVNFPTKILSFKETLHQNNFLFTFSYKTKGIRMKL